MPDWLGWLFFAGLLGVAELVTLRFAAGLMALAGAELPEPRNRLRDPRYPRSAAYCLVEVVVGRPRCVLTSMAMESSRAGLG